MLAARSRDDLQTVAAHCRDAGARVLVVPTDVGDEEAVRTLAKPAREFADSIDFWFSNVGVGAEGKFLGVPMAIHDQIVRSNLIGHMNDAHAALPIFLKQGHGVFVNMISLGGFAGAPFAAACSARKFGLKGFSEALRADLADYPDVHICDVSPSFVDTPVIRHAANYTGKALSAPPPLLNPRCRRRAPCGSSAIERHSRGARLGFATKPLHLAPAERARRQGGVRALFRSSGAGTVCRRQCAAATWRWCTDRWRPTLPVSEAHRNRDHGRDERIRARRRSAHNVQNGGPRVIPDDPTFEMSAPCAPMAVAADEGLEEEAPAKEIGAGQQQRMRCQKVGFLPVLTTTLPPDLFAPRGRQLLAREECH